MKNLNPTSGLRQITSGYFCLPRKIILKLIKNKSLKPLELGYFIIFLASADWDSDVNRKGFIRHETSELSAIWNLPYSTLHDHIKKLDAKQLLTMEKDTPKVSGFERFTSKGAQIYVKNKPTIENLKKTFPILLNNSGIPKRIRFNNPLSFNVSSRVESNVYSEKVVIKQEARNDEEYKRIWQDISSPSKFTIDDMKWIDRNI